MSYEPRASSRARTPSAGGSLGAGCVAAGRTRSEGPDPLHGRRPGISDPIRRCQVHRPRRCQQRLAGRELLARQPGRRDLAPLARRRAGRSGREHRPDQPERDPEHRQELVSGDRCGRPAGGLGRPGRLRRPAGSGYADHSHRYAQHVDRKVRVRGAADARRRGQPDRCVGGAKARSGVGRHRRAAPDRELAAELPAPVHGGHRWIRPPPGLRGPGLGDRLPRLVGEGRAQRGARRSIRVQRGLFFHYRPDGRAPSVTARGQVQAAERLRGRS